MFDNQDVTSFMSNVYRVLRKLKDIRHPESNTIVVQKVLNRLSARFSNFFTYATL